jgi:peptide/nickel transport system substrate-binding protein
MSHFDSPASMSMHEEATGAVNRPMMGVFNNLVMYRQDVAQNSMASIVPDLAIGWSSNEEGTELTLPLRPGVRWHDGKPFTAKDVKCTWDLLTARGMRGPPLAARAGDGTDRKIEARAHRARFARACACAVCREISPAG